MAPRSVSDNNINNINFFLVGLGSCLSMYTYLFLRLFLVGERGDREEKVRNVLVAPCSRSQSTKGTPKRSQNAHTFELFISFYFDFSLLFQWQRDGHWRTVDSVVNEPGQNRFAQSCALVLLAIVVVHKSNRGGEKDCSPDHSGASTSTTHNVDR